MKSMFVQTTLGGHNGMDNHSVILLSGQPELLIMIRATLLVLKLHFFFLICADKSAAKFMI
jgi:hypothetical protein